MKPSRAEFVTHCPDCQTEQGAVQDSFNRTKVDCSWRISLHGDKARGLPRCTGARMVVSELAIWPNERRQEAS